MSILTRPASGGGERRTTGRGAPAARRPGSRPLLREVRAGLPLYVMAAGGLVYFLVFHYFPMYGAVIAFKEYRAVDGILGSAWVGLENFKKVFSSTYFTNILTNTLLISAYKLVVMTPAAVLLAVMLNEVRVRWFKRAVQTITYLPHFLSWIVVYGIALVVLSPSTGLANKGLEALGLDPVNFLVESDWFRGVLVGAEVWKNVGWNAIVYLAALAGISPTLYEAASVDGASRLQRMRHVTLPGLLPVIVLVTTLNIGQLLSAGFEQVFAFYNPAVYEVADIIDTWVYRQGIESFQYSVAAAVGLFKGVCGAVLIVTANWASKRWTKTGIW